MTKNDNDAKTTEILIVDDMYKFNQLSIADGIDEIVTQLINIEQIIDDNNSNNNNNNNSNNFDSTIKSIKHHLSVVQNQLRSTQTKCNEITQLKVENDELHNKSVKDDKMITKLKCEISELKLIDTKNIDSSNSTDIDILNQQVISHNSNYVKSKLSNLETQLSNGSEKLSLSLLVKMKKLEQQVQVQKQTMEVLIL